MAGPLYCSFVGSLTHLGTTLGLDTDQVVGPVRVAGNWDIAAKPLLDQGFAERGIDKADDRCAAASVRPTGKIPPIL
jgi:hypothetical protein